MNFYSGQNKLNWTILSGVDDYMHSTNITKLHQQDNENVKAFEELSKQEKDINNKEVSMMILVTRTGENMRNQQYSLTRDTLVHLHSENNYKSEILQNNQQKLLRFTKQHVKSNQFGKIRRYANGKFVLYPKSKNLRKRPRNIINKRHLLISKIYYL